MREKKRRKCKLIEVIVPLVLVLGGIGLLYWLLKEERKENARYEEREKEFLELEREKRNYLQRMSICLDVYTDLLCEYEIKFV